MALLSTLTPAICVVLIQPDTKWLPLLVLLVDHPHSPALAHSRHEPGCPLRCCLCHFWVVLACAVRPMAPWSLRAPSPSPQQVGDAEGPTRLNQLPVRWAVLALQCVALIGSYYCYDNPTAIENPLKAYFHITNSSSSAASSKFNTNYNLLYSVYSFPNTVRPRGWG